MTWVDDYTDQRRAEQKAKRDDLAKAAMQGLCGCLTARDRELEISNLIDIPSAIAKEAYRIADAMLRESKKESSA